MTYPTYRIYGRERTLTVTLPCKRMGRIWHWLETVSRRYQVDPELVLAITLVETALAPLPDPEAIRPMSDVALAHLRQWLGEDDRTEPSPILALAYAAGHLGMQRMRFSRLSLALVAYHTTPDWVDDHGDAVLDMPCYRDYVRAVLSTMTWLCDTQPWRRWDRCPPPDTHEPFRPIHWLPDPDTGGLP